MTNFHIVKALPKRYPYGPFYGWVAGSRAVVEPVHAFLEGIFPCCIRKVMIVGKFCAMPSVDWDVEEDAASI